MSLPKIESLASHYNSTLNSFTAQDPGEVPESVCVVSDLLTMTSPDCEPHRRVTKSKVSTLPT